MNYKVIYLDKAEKDLENIDPNNQERIISDIENKLRRRPSYFGERRKTTKGKIFRVLKCGYNRDWRVAYTVKEKDKVVLINHVRKKGTHGYKELY